MNTDTLMNPEKLIETVMELLTTYGLKIIAAIAILLIGRIVAGFTKKIVVKVMQGKKVDPMIVSFTGSITYFALLTFFVLAALSAVGIQTTSFVAVIGAAGLAIGLALQGSLANFAAGFLLILFRPFRVDDYIEAGGTGGIVEEIHVLTTQLRTPDNKTVIVPNSKILGDNIVNYSRKGTRRVDMVFGIGYGDDIDKARKVMSAVIAADSRILKDPAPVVAVSELGDSSVNFVVRPWVKAGDYWNVFFEVTETIKKKLDENGISIPFPQRDVHIYEHKSD